MPQKNKKSTNKNISVLLYLVSGFGFGIWIGLIASLLAGKLTSLWINNNVPLENQDVGDASVIFAIAIAVFGWCVILGIFGGFIYYIKENKRN